MPSSVRESASPHQGVARPRTAHPPESRRHRASVECIGHSCWVNSRHHCGWRKLDGQNSEDRPRRVKAETIDRLARSHKCRDSEMKPVASDGYNYSLLEGVAGVPKDQVGFVVAIRAITGSCVNRAFGIDPAQQMMASRQPAPRYRQSIKPHDKALLRHRQRLNSVRPCSPEVENPDPLNLRFASRVPREPRGESSDG